MVFVATHCCCKITESESWLSTGAKVATTEGRWLKPFCGAEKIVRCLRKPPAPRQTEACTMGKRHEKLYGALQGIRKVLNAILFNLQTVELTSP